MKFAVSVFLLVVAQAAAYGPNTICDKKTAIQSTTGKWDYPGYAERAVDDIKSTDGMQQGCTHTDYNDVNPWLMVDLGCRKSIESVTIINRDVTPERLRKFVILVYNGLPNPYNGILCALHDDALSAGTHTIKCDKTIEGRFITIKFQDPASIPAESRFIHICDVSVP